MTPRLRITLYAAAVLAAAARASIGAAVELKAGDPAPLFTARTQDGSQFTLADRKGHWTVLYFYPRAGTPGCTKQACAFRDSIATIRGEGAEVYGISTDTVEDQAAFHKEEQLDFPLLADPDATVTEAYGAKMPLVSMAKRWTFIIDPTLTIRQVQRDVDPSQDAQRVATEIARLKAEPAKGPQGATPGP
jgi:peroxiredoxin Q/BCP